MGWMSLNPTAHRYLLEAAKRMRKLNAQIELCETDDDIRDAIGACFSYTRDVMTAASFAGRVLDGPPIKKKQRREI